jgi:hypothetical protein
VNAPRRHLCALALLLLCAVGSWTAGAAAGRYDSSPPSPQSIRYWIAVGSCETGGGGPPRWDWGAKHRSGEGPLFQGGLGFSSSVWAAWASELGLAKLYPHAYDAPPLVQIRVAEYGMKVHGARWGCTP